MGMGRKKDREKQQGLWVAASEIVATPGHVFYERLNVVLNAEKFDQRVEAMCRKYYKSSWGRPSITETTSAAFAEVATEQRPMGRQRQQKQQQRQYSVQRERTNQKQHCGTNETNSNFHRQ